MFSDEDILMSEYISISEGNIKKIKYVAEGILNIVFKYRSWNLAIKHPLSGLKKQIISTLVEIRAILIFTQWKTYVFI